MSVGEVAAQLAVEVRRDVRVGAVDAGVDDADPHALALLVALRAGGGGADLLHVPLEVGERLRAGAGVRGAAVRRGVRRDARLDVGLRRVELLDVDPGAASGALPIAWLCATPSMAFAAVALAAKSAFVVATVATPTAVFSLSTVPPAAAIAACAASVEAPAA